MSGSAQIEISGTTELFTRVNELSVEMRGPIVRSGMNAIGRIISARAKQLVRKEGMQGYNKRSPQRLGKKRLVETIGHVVREYHARKFSGFVLVVGPQYPAGSHGHLVEHGHRVSQVGSGTLHRIKRPGKRQFSTPRSTIGKTGQGKHITNTRPFPFMEPAARDSEGKIAAAVESSLKRAIDKALGSG